MDATTKLAEVKQYKSLRTYCTYFITFDLFWKIGVCVCGGGGGGGGGGSHQSESHMDAHLASTSFSASIF